MHIRRIAHLVSVQQQSSTLKLCMVSFNMDIRRVVASSYGFFFLVVVLFTSLLLPVSANVVVLRHNNVTEADYVSYGAFFGSVVDSDGITGYLVVADPPDACDTIEPRTNYDRNVTVPRKWVVLIKRGKCSFSHKVWIAQVAGYDAAIVHNTNSEALIHMSSSGDDNVHISSVFVGEREGTELHEKYQWDTGFIVVLTDEFPIININTILLPFAIVVGVCFLMLFGFVIGRWIRERRRQQRHRLPKRELKKIPTKRYADGDKYDVCAICLEQFTVGEKVRVLPCEHLYHPRCIDPWLLNNKRVCPVCKQKVIPGDNSDSDDDEHHHHQQSPTTAYPNIQGGVQASSSSAADSAAAGMQNSEAVLVHSSAYAVNSNDSGSSIDADTRPPTATTTDSLNTSSSSSSGGGTFLNSPVLLSGSLNADVTEAALPKIIAMPSLSISLPSTYALMMPSPSHVAAVTEGDEDDDDHHHQASLASSTTPSPLQGGPRTPVGFDEALPLLDSGVVVGVSSHTAGGSPQHQHNRSASFDKKNGTPMTTPTLSTPAVGRNRPRSASQTQQSVASAFENVAGGADQNVNVVVVSPKNTASSKVVVAASKRSLSTASSSSSSPSYVNKNFNVDEAGEQHQPSSSSVKLRVPPINSTATDAAETARRRPPQQQHRRNSDTSTRTSQSYVDD